MAQSIGPFITKRVLVLKYDTPAQVAARALYERQVGCAVVSDRHGHIVGMVTDRDLATQVLGFNLPVAIPISEVMTTDIYWISEEASLENAIQVMSDYGIRRLPVVELTSAGREKCIGIVSLDDLIVARAVDLENLSGIVRKQVFKAISNKTALSRSEERKEQTLSRFNKVLSQNMELGKDLGERIAFHLLKDIVCRLPYTEAAHFISQLPSLIQEDLVNLPAGPNDNISAESMIEGLMFGFQFDRETAEDVLKKFWVGMEELLDEGILDYVLRRLPKDIKGALGSVLGKQGFGDTSPPPQM